MFGKICGVSTVTLLAGLFGPALADGGDHHHHGDVATQGTFLAQGLVLSVSSDTQGITCPSTAGAAYLGTVTLSEKGTLATLREASNTPSGASIFRADFTAKSGTIGATSISESGTFIFATIGLTPQNGTYTATITPQDNASWTAVFNLTYPYTAGNVTANCTESDQLALLSTATGH